MHLCETILPRKEQLMQTGWPSCVRQRCMSRAPSCSKLHWGLRCSQAVFNSLQAAI